jgi:hypothetical protein
LEERSGLFWEFAELDPTEETIRQFADKFGSLGPNPELQSGSQLGPIELRTESLALWEREIKKLQEAVILWRLTASGNNKLLRDLKARLNPRDVPLALQRYLHVARKTRRCSCLLKYRGLPICA